MLGEEGRLSGAAYNPAADIVPVLALPPETLFTCHVTLLVEAPETLAWNCCV